MSKAECLMTYCLLRKRPCYTSAGAGVMKKGGKTCKNSLDRSAWAQVRWPAGRARLMDVSRADGVHEELIPGCVFAEGDAVEDVKQLEAA